jgi:hypothetical protein
MMVSLLFAIAVAAQSPDATIDGIVAAARSFDERLPNYICKQVTTRQTGPTMDGPWKQVDAYEEQLTYFNRKESRTLQSINGKPVDRKKRPRGGLHSSNLFGGMLFGVFRVESKTEFEHDGEDAIDGRKAIRLRYRVLRENSRWKSTQGNPIRTKTYVRGFKGHVWADAKTLDVLRFTGQIEAEPGDPDFLGKTKIDMRYGFVKIGEAEHLLPVRSEVTLELDKKPKRNVAVYSDFRQYTTETKIEFGEPK